MRVKLLPKQHNFSNSTVIMNNCKEEDFDPFPRGNMSVTVDSGLPSAGILASSKISLCSLFQVLIQRWNIWGEFRSSLSYICEERHRARIPREGDNKRKGGGEREKGNSGFWVTILCDSFSLPPNISSKTSAIIELFYNENKSLIIKGINNLAHFVCHNTQSKVKKKTIFTYSKEKLRSLPLLQMGWMFISISLKQKPETVF